MTLNSSTDTSGSAAVMMAKESRIKAVSLARDFSWEWDREVDNYKSSISGTTMDSPLELLLNLGAVITARNEFGSRYDKLVSQLDEEGKQLLRNGENWGVILEITEAIDEVFEESHRLDLEFFVSGTVRGELGDTEFQMSSDSFFIQRNWHYKYDTNPEIRKLKEEKKAAKSAARENRREKYEAEVRNVQKENEELDRKKENELKRILIELKAEHTNKIRLLNEERDDPRLDALMKEKADIQNKISETNAELSRVNAFNLPAKKKLNDLLAELHNSSLSNVNAEIKELEAYKKRKRDLIDYDYAAKAQTVRKILDLKYKHKPAPYKLTELYTEDDNMIEETKQATRKFMKDRTVYADEMEGFISLIDQKYKPYAASAVKQLLEEDVISYAAGEGNRAYYCSWSSEDFSKIVPDADSFEFTDESIENVRKKDFENASGNNARLRYELTDFFNRYEGHNLKTGEQYMSSYLASNVSSAQSEIGKMRRAYFLVRRRTMEGVDTCRVIARGKWFLNEYRYYKTDKFIWEKTYADEAELRYMARIPDKAVNDVPRPVQGSGESRPQPSAPSPAPSSVPAGNTVNAVNTANIPEPPVPLDGLTKEVYMLVAGSGGEVNLNDICIKFPDENRGRLKSVLFNLCSDNILTKKSTPSGDAYRLR